MIASPPSCSCSEDAHPAEELPLGPDRALMREKASSLIARRTTRCATPPHRKRSRITRQSSFTLSLTSPSLHRARIPTQMPPFVRAGSNRSTAVSSNRSRLSPPPPSRLAFARARPSPADDTSDARSLARPTSPSGVLDPSSRPRARRIVAVRPPTRPHRAFVSLRTSRPPRALARFDRRATRRGAFTAVVARAIVVAIAAIVVVVVVDVCDGSRANREVAPTCDCPIKTFTGERPALCRV